jgi:hypothetical protein
MIIYLITHLNSLFLPASLSPNAQQSIIQTIEQDTPYILALISNELPNIFGPQATSMFIETTPKKFLFEGVEFCRDPVGIPQIVCMSIEERKSPTIVKTDDGRALKFSMFNHVRKCLSLAELMSASKMFTFRRKTRHTTASTRSTRA